jgi:hypothetical protein
MKTLQQALTWVDQQNGKLLDFDRKWGGQCVDLISYYLQFLGLQIQWVAKACELWGRNIAGTHTSDKPVVGAIVVWTNKVGSGYGSCAIVRNVYADGTFDVLHENPKGDLNVGGACVWQRRNMTNVAGFIVPDFTAEQAPAPAQPAPAPTPAAPPAPATTNNGLWPKVDASVVGKTLYLKPYVKRWRVYPPDKEPRIGNEKAFVCPAEFGGLSYSILAVTGYPQVVRIKTQMFGECNIFVDGDAEIR